MYNLFTLRQPGSLNRPQGDAPDNLTVESAGEEQLASQKPIPARYATELSSEVLVGEGDGEGACVGGKEDDHYVEV